MTSSTRRPARLAAPFIVGALAFAACGDDTASEPAAAEAPATDPPTTEAIDIGPIEVIAVDYGFQGLPDTVDAGTVLSLINKAPAELHELVAIRLPDDEQRPVSELVTLPMEELGAILATEPATVLLALPEGGEMIPAVGDGTLGETGRYAIICMIPQGADVEEFLEAAATSEGPPQVDGGPPHVALGMFTELRVT